MTMNYFNEIMNLKPVFWKKPGKLCACEALSGMKLSYADIVDADNRLRRFAPLIRKLFPETVDGIIESDLVRVPGMKKALESKYGRPVAGDVFLKCDNYLKIAGSIKARGGIYEVLKHAEDLVLQNNLLDIHGDYSEFAGPGIREFFNEHEIAVGSTGNLGLSIGIISSALGFKVTVHMSHDAKPWKKELLRSKGVNVVEHPGDFTAAVEEGRKQCMEKSDSYFIDDENSETLFLGYSTAALRLNEQIKKAGIRVDDSHPLNVYLPCGVGGSPGGIAFGLKYVFGDAVRCFLVEPTHSPSMLLGLITGKYGEIHVNDYGIDNITDADGLAVGSPSKLAAPILDRLVDGIYTIDDRELYSLLSMLKDSEAIKVEPSSAAALKGPILTDADNNTTHICWMTGGLLIPEEIYSEMYKKGIG
jgi:D-serine dehydratase